MTSPRSTNFGFMAARYDKIERLAAYAELDWSLNPVGCLTTLRTFAEQIGRTTTAKLRIPPAGLKNFADVLDALERQRIPESAIELFHSLRVTGNEAAHRGLDTAALGLQQLGTAHQLAVWFHRTFHDPAFEPGAFVTPEDPAARLAALAARVRELEGAAALERSTAEAEKDRAAALTARADEEALARLIAEERADATAADRDLWKSLAEEADAMARAPEPPDLAAVLADFFARAERAARKITRTEADARRDVDRLLREAGWEADTESLRWEKGARPSPGRFLAIAECPTAVGPADYVLFHGVEAVAVVEAKRRDRSLRDGIDQAARYARASAPTLALVYATNGRALLRQLVDRSGVMFLDLREGAGEPRSLAGFHSPDGVKALLARDLVKSQRWLANEPVASLKLRDYQNEAIAAVEDALAHGARRALLAMATGTGKTSTAIGLVYRALSSGLARRVLFVVDRESLGAQGLGAFSAARVSGELTFSQVFNLVGLKGGSPELDTHVHITTVQSLVVRTRADAPPPVDQYDLIVVDECHRGYVLDREMSDAELEGRDVSDYVSRYRRAIDHFDAPVVGLTATPAPHTIEIFGQPVFRYTFTRAVTERRLVPQAPVTRIVTLLARDGIQLKLGEEVKRYDRATTEIELESLPDELSFDVDEFNRSVLTEDFNRVVCDALAEELDPSLEDKCIVFCVDDVHATMVARLLSASMRARWGDVHADTVRKLTGQADQVQELVVRFRNEALPQVAVTVDLLSTGVDVPKVSAVVFLRRVRSRILYEQMLGRATRLCPAIGKDSFRVFDAVGQTGLMAGFTTMTPTAVSPSFTAQELCRELVDPSAGGLREQALARLTQKLQRKRRAIESRFREAFEEAAGEGPSELIARLKGADDAEQAAWWLKHPEAVVMLDRVSAATENRPVLYEGKDDLVSVYQDYDGRAPDDYLEGFGRWVRENMNLLPALTVAATAPWNLTRKDLLRVAEVLASKGYDDARLRSAHRAMTNADIAATLVGFIRQRALGDPLVAYETRVDRALDRVVASRPWNSAQLGWLRRIGAQLKLQTVIDREALEQPPFAERGGWAAIDRSFGGELSGLLQTLHEAVWRDAG